MRDTKNAESYNNQYVNIGFERSGLFSLIRKKFNPGEVLYPGCSVHITPAFYFPHVVFVDKDPGVREVFADLSPLLALLNRRRTYRRSPYIEFIFQDFSNPLPLRERSFDMALALFTGGISRTVKPYLKIGGLLVTNNHQEDALDAVRDPQYGLVGAIRRSKGDYQLLEGDSLQPRDEAPETLSRKYLRQTSCGEEYIEDETYFIFKRMRARR